MATPDLPAEVRERAVSTLLDLYRSRDKETWLTLAEQSVDAVAEVLAEHQQLRSPLEDAISERRQRRWLEAEDDLTEALEQRDALAKTVAERDAEAKEAALAYNATARELLREKDEAVAERDALLARVEHLRAALGWLADGYCDVPPHLFAKNELTADDRAAGRAKEEK